MKGLLLAGALAGALSIGTTAICAQEHRQDDRSAENRSAENRSAENRTYTDSKHARHEWNSDEDAAWKRYRDEHHVKQGEFSRANRKQQDAYWKWRQDHPDEHRDERR